MESRLYSISELTNILKLHPKTILRFIHEGKIKARKIGRAWRVSESDLKTYCHGELSSVEKSQEITTQYDTLKNRINISAVIEVNEQNSEEASRISNSFMAMLNSEKEYDGKSRFDFFYYPEIERAKYVFYGNTQFILRIINMFDLLAHQKEGGK